MCRHFPPCPSAADTCAASAVIVTEHHEQGWALLCNGVVLFNDGGLLLPDGSAVAAPARSLVAA